MVDTKSYFMLVAADISLLLLPDFTSCVSRSVSPFKPSIRTNELL